MAHRGCLPGDLVAAQLVLFGDEILEYLDEVIRMALGVDAPRKREAHQIHAGRGLGAVRSLAEHHGTDLAGSDSALDVEGDRERLARILKRSKVGKHAPRIDEHGVASRGFDDWYAESGQAFADVSTGPQPVAQIVFVDDFTQPLRD